MFHETPKYRNSNFEPLKQTLPEPGEAPHPLTTLHMDGNPDLDRPLFVQFCSNSPSDLYQAARYVAPFCDAVDLNLGCPQGIAKRGKYGAFLQEDWKLIHDLINRLHNELDVPVTAKIRILDTNERTLEYAKMVLEAGASIITVHGRQRDQKGHNTGLADWTVLRYLRENLPRDTVIFANGNILQYEDINECLQATGADAVMSAEGNLYDPSIFAQPPAVGQEGRDYWRGRDGKGGYRMDAALRRYMDILYKHVLQTEPPARKPLFVTSDPVELTTTNGEQNGNAGTEVPTAPVAAPVPSKKRKRAEMKHQNNGKNNKEVGMSINLKVVQAHLFHMLRPLVAKHTHVRDALARSRAGDVPAFENVLQLTEQVIKQGLIDYENGVDDGMPAEKPKKEVANGASTNGDDVTNGAVTENGSGNNITGQEAAQTDGDKKLAEAEADFTLSSEAAVLRCRRPWWIMQPYVRPLPDEAFKNGALTLSRKERARLEQEAEETKKAGLVPEGRVETQVVGTGEVVDDAQQNDAEDKVEIARDGIVSG
jgi:tRNA-dihydrouridine synthase 1